jgi:hypothetical protein
MSDVLKRLEEQKGEAEKKHKEATEEKTRIDAELGHPPDSKRAELKERTTELEGDIAFFDKVAKDLDAAIHALKDGASSRGSIIGDE